MSDGRAARSFASLAIGETVARGLAFVALLVVARRLGPAMYGVIGVASGVMLYLNQVADGGIELSGVPAIARLRDGIQGLVSAALTVRVTIALALTLVVAVSGVFLLEQPDGAILALYSLGLVFVATSTRWVFLGMQQSGWVAAARVLGDLTALAIVVLAVHDVGDVAMVPIAAVLALALSAIVMFAGLSRLGIKPAVTLRWDQSRALFARSPHLVGFTLLGLVLFNADLIYLRVISGQAAAGYYAAAYTFIAFAANLSVTWAHSVMPSLARLERHDASRDEAYASAMLLAVLVSLPVAVGGMITSAPLIQLVFGSDYLPAVAALAWLLPAIPIAAAREIAIVGLIGSVGGERQLIRINAMCAAFNVAILIPVVPRFGMIGAAAVTVATEAVRLAIALRYASQHGYALPSPRRVVRPVAAAGIMAAGLVFRGERPLFVLVAAGGLLYLVGLVITGVVRVGVGDARRIVV